MPKCSIEYISQILNEKRISWHNCVPMSLCDQKFLLARYTHINTYIYLNFIKNIFLILKYIDVTYIFKLDVQISISGISA